MDPLVLLLLIGTAAIAGTAALLHNRLRAAEAHAARALARLRRHRDAHAARMAEVVREIEAPFDPPAPPHAQP